MKRTSLLIATCCLALSSCGQKEAPLPVMETGGQQMPEEWIDQATGHRVIKLTRREGSNRSFYFHNNPFIGDEMLFVGDDAKRMTTDQRAGGNGDVNRQMYAVNLKTLAIRQITNEPYSVSSELVCNATHELFFLHADTVWSVNIDNCEKRMVTVLPSGAAGISTVNCDGTLLAGTFNNPQEAEIIREHPAKGEFFNLIYDAHLEKTIFTIDTRTGEVDRVHTDNAWLNHLQFSPANPTMLGFCHEGPWHKVNRIWNIDVKEKGEPRLMHVRTMDMEIAGHEWWSANGKNIWFDLQKPRSVNFLIGCTDAITCEEKDYKICADTWSVHFVTSQDESFLVGDGGDPVKSVAASDQDQWIFRYDFVAGSDSLNVTKLVDMHNHNYALEPNVHLTPDQKWVVFRANFEGNDNVYAVEL